MKHIKRFIKVLTLVMALSVLSPSIVPLSNLSVAEAATVKLNKKKLTLEVGKSATLKLTGTKAKVTWSSSNKAVATVNTKGKVTAKKAGKATITATVSKKKYTCTVTVKKTAVQENTKAPFTSQEAKLGKIKYLYPKDWTNNVILGEGIRLLSILSPGNADLMDETSNIILFVNETDQPIPEASEVKTFVETTFTKEYIEEQLGMTVDVSISNVMVSEYKVATGVACKVEFDSSITKGMVLKQCGYVLFLENYMLVLVANDSGDGEKLKLNEIVEYVANNVTVEK